MYARAVSLTAEIVPRGQAVEADVLRLLEPVLDQLRRLGDLQKLLPRLGLCVHEISSICPAVSERKKRSRCRNEPPNPFQVG
jgi:hypothetical protein